MNDLLPWPYDAIAYGFVCVLSLAMVVVTLGFLSYHCVWVEETTGIPGACGLGAGWILFALGFLAIAAYSGMQLYSLGKERE